MGDCRIRPGTLDDVDTIVEIEKNSFTSPWEKNIFYRISRDGGQFKVEDELIIFMNVMTLNNVVIGYVVWEEDYTDESGHILNLAITRGERNKGYGTQLIRSTFDAMISTGLETCELEVREKNSSARHLYEKVGMMAVDKAVKYYGDEDAIIYEIIFEH